MSTFTEVVSKTVLAHLADAGVNYVFVNDWTYRLESIPTAEQAVSTTDLQSIIVFVLTNCDSDLERRYPELTSAIEDMLEECL